MTVGARFTEGSTLRHVVVMAATGAVGLSALFLVDIANLFYISLLGQAELAAAIGFAGTLQFFLISVSIGLSIAATALVARAIGGGRRAEARRLAASAMVTLVAVLALISALVWLWRGEAVALLGARGATAALAADFLAIVLPSLPLLGIGMVSSGLLRAAGDARSAMWVTLGGGLFGAVVDPLLIFGFGLGLDGAAIAAVLSRLVVAGVGLSGVLIRHDLIGRPGPTALVVDAGRLLALAAPMVATQLSTPFGNAYLTRVVAPFGDEAVAAWAVVGRLTALAFGGIFALSGAVGPIFGQNLGAGLITRIDRTLRDAFLFATLYVAVAWALLWLATPLIVRGFGITGAGLPVIEAFTHWGAGAFAFTGALFVANAAFNNLGRPIWSTAFNWTRDAAVIPLLAAIVGTGLGPAGAVAVQAAAALIVGLAAAAAARAFVRRGRFAGAPARPATAETPAFASARAALGAAPLSQPQERR